MASLSDTAKQPPESIVIPFEWRLLNFSEKIKNTANEPIYSKVLSHESCPGVSWQFMVYPCEQTSDGATAVSVFLCATFGVSNGACRLHSDALTAAAAFSKLQLKSLGDGRVAVAKEMTIAKFGFPAKNWGRRHLWTRVVAEEFCDAENGSLMLCGEIVVQKHGGRHEEFSRLMLVSAEHSDLSLRLGRDQTMHLHKWIFSYASTTLAGILRRGRIEELGRGRSEQAIATLILHLYGYPLWLKDQPFLACEVHDLAERFGLKELKDACIVGIRETITVPNALSNYQLGVERNLEPLKRASVGFILQQVPTFFKSSDWSNLKTEKTGVRKAMSVCEDLILAIAEQNVEPARKKKRVDPVISASCNSAFPQASTTSHKVDFTWLIPGFKGILASDDASCIICPETFKNEAYPGISWNVVLYPKGKSGAKDSVAIYVRQVATSTKKSPATGLAIGFTLGFYRPGSFYGAWNEMSPVTLPSKAFHCGEASEIGFEDFCKRNYADSRCDTHGALTLSGKLAIETSSSPLLVHARRSFETGENADFEVKFGAETFAAHKFVLARSPKISGMLGTRCVETSNNALKIQAETTADAVKAMLQFWYDEPLLFDGLPDLSLEVLALAEEYQDWHLVKTCEMALLKMIDQENVFDFAALAFRHKAPDLATATVRFLAAHVDTLMRSENATWSKLKDANLELALEIAEAVIIDDASLRH